jgi:hypothetical protein
MQWKLLAVAAVMAAMAEQAGRQPCPCCPVLSCPVPCADANNCAECKPTHQDPQKLYKAAIDGDLTVVQQLIEHNPAAVDQRFEQHRTALHGAATSGHQHMPPVVSLLLSHGAAVDAVDACRLTPLHLAAQHGHVFIAQQLLDAQADVLATDLNSSNTPLHYAALHGHAQVARLLLQASKAAVHASNSQGVRPLHLAASRGHTAVVLQLLATGATASLPDAEGLSALHKAASAGHAAVVRAILQQQPLPAPELQVAVCFADIFGHAPVLAQLLLQLYQQQGSKAGTVLAHIAQGPRAAQQLSLALLKGWRGDTHEATAAAEAVARQQQEQAEGRAGLQHLAVGLLAQQRYGQER